MFYLIGLGLNEKGISLEGAEAIKKCKKVYLENYTVDFPYGKSSIEKVLGKRIIELDREKVEGEGFVEEAKSKNVALLIYGDALAATTHISLIFKCQKEKIPYKIIHAASIFDAIAETGLQLYKFGKITSMPKQDADFLKYVKENQSINAHSLILVDIGMELEETLERLEKQSKKEKLKIKKIIVCSKLGNEDSEIYYRDIDNLKQKKVQAPFCFIIPGELHFMEKKTLERF